MESITKIVLDTLSEMQEHACMTHSLNDSYEEIFDYLENGNNEIFDQIIDDYFKNYPKVLEKFRSLIIKIVVMNAYLGISYLKEHHVSLSLKEIELLNNLKNQSNQKNTFINSLKINRHFEMIYPYFYKIYLSNIYNNKEKIAIVYRLCPILLNDILKEKEEVDKNSFLEDLNNLKYSILSLNNREIEELYGFDKLELCFLDFLEDIDSVGYIDYYDSELIEMQKIRKEGNLFYLETNIEVNETMDNYIDEILDEEEIDEEETNEENTEFQIVEDLLFLNSKNVVEKLYKYIVNLKDKDQQEQIIKCFIKRFILGYEIANFDTEIGYKYSLYATNNSISKNIKLFLNDKIFGTMITSTCLYTQQQLDNLTDIEIQLQQKYETLKKYSDPEVKEKQYEKQGGKFSN